MRDNTIHHFVFNAIPSKDIIIDSGKDCFLYDSNDKKYLDLGAGIWCAILGHSNLNLINAIKSQAEKLIHLGSGFYSKIVYDAIEEICSITPKNMKKVILLCTGSEATECALKIAKVFTDKYEIIGMERGYYGITFAAQSVSGFGPQYGMNFPHMVGTHKILAPYCYRCPVKKQYPECNFLCLEVSKQLIDSNTSGKIAGFLLEPMLAAGGIIIPPEGYFKRLKEIADEYNAILIADEVSTGIGRTGKWFGFQHYDFTPDILYISKTLGGGFPIAAVITSPEIEMECQKKHMIHTQSHMFDPLPAASAKAVIKEVKQENLIDKAERKGKYFLDRLQELKEKYEIIGDVRGKGLMLGIEIVDPKTNRQNPDLGLKLEQRLLQKGLIMSFSSFTSVFRLFPPLIIEKEIIDNAIEIIDQVFSKFV